MESRVTAELLRGMPLPQPDERGDKEQRGRVLAVGGSVEVPGGALLAGLGALRAGAGKLQVATCRSVAPHLGLALPECRAVGLPETEAGGIAPEAAGTVIEGGARCGALLIGPGMMDQPAVEKLTARVLEGLEPGGEGPAIVLDAAALIGLGETPERTRRHAGRIVVTPHAGEMAGLLGIGKDEVNDDPRGTALRAAERLGAVVALKGSTTWIASPEGKAWSYSGGCVGLATSGSGDTLAGIVAGLLARGATPLEAAAWGVYLHGEAGNRLTAKVAPLGFLARELLAEVPCIMAEFAG
ncbi:NAD(P)H-hydrate dehydratase [Azospirillum sp. SYSU D00513]|uniref:NAD(P)H-hydrate dehydratase n=1 Tax=Azospirillum sp. SYSU D00513 TaxID=2812561 RepID=UPI00200003C6|nr:NAD(P)H-hydrate dehydratase [Azospirillum sp. SYSU D00513]